MHLLLAVWSTSPLPVAYVVRTMSDCMPRHRACFPFVQIIVYVAPIHGPRLCFNHPEVLAFQPSHSVVAHSVYIRIQVPGPDVVVPGGKCQRSGGLVLVQTVPFQPHEIPSDELPWVRVFANLVELILLKGIPRVRHEALPL